MKPLILALLLSGCASDTDSAAQPPEPPTPANVCENLASIGCVLEPCVGTLVTIWEVAPAFGVDVTCLQTTATIEGARACGWPCGETAQ